MARVPVRNERLMAGGRRDVLTNRPLWNVEAELRGIRMLGTDEDGRGLGSGLEEVAGQGEGGRTGRIGRQHPERGDTGRGLAATHGTD